MLFRSDQRAQAESTPRVPAIGDSDEPWRVLIYNPSETETIPAYGAVRVTEAEPQLGRNWRRATGGQPDADSCNAVAWPMPLEHPVMSTARDRVVGDMIASAVDGIAFRPSGQPSQAGRNRAARLEQP